MSRGDSYGLGGGSSYFNDVTGTNDYERQSWRDSNNGGKAAGDWTGNTNARLEAERDAFQGATWSGSSSQPSALQLAQSMVGPGASGQSTGASASVGGGVGSAVVGSAPQVAKAAAKGSLTIPGVGKAPLTQGVKDTATGGYAGVEWLPNPWFSDVEEFWEPRMGEPGEWLGGIVNIGADIPYNTGRFLDFATGTDIVSGSRPDKRVALDDMLSGPGVLTQVGGAFGRQFGTWDRQIHEVVGGGKPYVGGGF